MDRGTVVPELQRLIGAEGRALLDRFDLLKPLVEQMVISEAIARTLLSNPKLLVMDEATSALDYETERKVCDNLLGNLNDRTVFFITHRLSTIRQADLIVMLHQGAVVEVGTHDELINQRGRYYALYRQQESS